MIKVTLTGRLVNNEPPLQDYWPAEKRIAIAGIIYHWMYGSPCNGEDCDVCKAMRELKNESH